MRSHERWIWVELIGFDVEQPDYGVAEYLDTAGFTPDVICLLLTSPDFVLSHEDYEGEVELPPDYCSRDGHEFGRHRQRQKWTNRQLQGLIRGLQERGIKVFLTVFTAWYRDKFHQEWLGQHREVFYVFRSLGVGYAINPTARLADGTPFADLWARKLVQTLKYYGFDGWQGADGWGPLSGPIWEVDFSDDTVAQFAESRGAGVSPASDQLPDVVTQQCGYEVEKLQARADWIWRNARSEWIAFWSERWASFWRTVLEALHAKGKQAVINSAWGRAPFEALYRYGVDYQKIAAAGVDGMIVETAAAGLSLDPRAADEGRHFDFLSMFGLVRAYLPDLRLIFLHNAHDIVEEWDALRHVPAVLEKEIWSLANVWHVTRNGALESPPTGVQSHLRPAADAFLVCLGDGLSAEEWGWLRRKWEFSFGEAPHGVLGATLVWSDAAMQAEVEDFTQNRCPLSHRLIFELMTHGAPIGATVGIEDLQAAHGPLLVINSHLLPAEEMEALLKYDRGPVMMIGRAGASLNAYVTRGGNAVIVEERRLPGMPDDAQGLIDSRGYWDHMKQRLPDERFYADCIHVMWHMVLPDTSFPADQVCLAGLWGAEGRLRLAIKSKIWVYCKPEINLGREIESIDVVTEFPSVRVRPEGSKFSVRIPPRGIVVLDVVFK